MDLLGPATDQSGKWPGRAGDRDFGVKLSFRNAMVLWGDDLQTRDFCWQGAIITGENFGHSVDLSGFMVFPGFVDVHGDGFEHHLAKRRGVLKDIQFGFHAAHNELASNGIFPVLR